MATTRIPDDTFNRIRTELDELAKELRPSGSNGNISVFQHRMTLVLSRNGVTDLVFVEEVRERAADWKRNTLPRRVHQAVKEMGQLFPFTDPIVY